MTASDRQRIVALWLILCCATLFAMVVLGGVTRLTGSGLSMVKWEPVTGVLPPLDHAEWEEVFGLYKQYPEYRKRNFGMSLDDFKSIYWVEYAHRLLGRLIGVVFLVPLVYFLVTGRVGRELAPKLILLFVLGGLQGLLGWYMVKSGLVQDPHVSPYRLTAHLGLAFVIYAYMLWVALDLLYPRAGAIRPGPRRPWLPVAAAIATLIFVTALSGAFVAGNHAGLAYNSFPTMGGQWIPDGLFTLKPLWRNFFENVTTVQFDHRVLALLVFTSVLVFWWTLRKRSMPPGLRIGIHLLLGVACLQVGLGIATLLWRVPTPLASAHQAGALLLLTVAVYVVHRVRTLGA